MIVACGARAFCAAGLLIAAAALTSACGPSSPTAPGPPPPPPPPPTISFESDNEDVEADAVVLEMTASGIDSFTLVLQAVEVTDMFGVALDIVFDPAAITLNTTEFGPFLEEDGVTVLRQIVENPEGTLVTVQTRSGDATGVSGSGAVLQLDFASIATGSTTIAIQNAGAIDGMGAPLMLEFVGGTIFIPEGG